MTGAWEEVNVLSKHCKSSQEILINYIFIYDLFNDAVTTSVRTQKKIVWLVSNVLVHVIVCGTIPEFADPSGRVVYGRSLTGIVGSNPA
jgi:hypothetical protein